MHNLTPWVSLDCDQHRTLRDIPQLPYGTLQTIVNDHEQDD